MSEHILIIEDDARLAELVRAYLTKQGYRVDWHARGDTAEAVIIELQPDLVILDVMLPGKSGFDICRSLLPHYRGLILILTASEDDVDEIIGLELGADDYLAKPIEPRLLLARIRALLRRKQPTPMPTHETSKNGAHAASSLFTAGELVIDPENRCVMLHQQALEFTTAEFDLLWLLASHAGQILSRDDIFQLLRGIDFDGFDRSIDARISRLRRKLQDDPDHPQRIKTVRGKGYLFLNS